MKAVRQFIHATRELSGRLDRLRFPQPVRFVYNPLEYASAAHEQYLRRFLHSHQDVLFLGMNPGPFGMAQTGVPFGEVNAVRDWLGVHANVTAPERHHPRKPVRGFDCARSEVSGRRLWGLFERRFGTPDQFFRRHFVYNYCPLLFIDGGPNGRNLTPENLSGPVFRELEQECDQHLLRLLECCGARKTVGIGNFAARRLNAVVGGNGVEVVKILHPSPASPAANRDWAGAATRELERCGIW